MKSGGLLLLLAGFAHAQSVGYGVAVAPGWERTVSPSAKTSAFGVGGGFETMLSPQFLERFTLGPNIDLQGILKGTGQAANSVGILSLDPSLHIKGNERLDWFLVGGYSLVFSDYGASGWNAGAGLNIWALDHNRALRIEFREEGARPPLEPYVHTGPYTHYLGVRIGMTFGNRPGGN